MINNYANDMYVQYNTIQTHMAPDRCATYDDEYVSYNTPNSE